MKSFQWSRKTLAFFILIRPVFEYFFFSVLFSVFLLIRRLSLVLKSISAPPLAAVVFLTHVLSTRSSMDRHWLLLLRNIYVTYTYATWIAISAVRWTLIYSRSQPVLHRFFWILITRFTLWISSLTTYFSNPINYISFLLTHSFSFFPSILSILSKALFILLYNLSIFINFSNSVISFLAFVFLLLRLLSLSLFYSRLLKSDLQVFHKSIYYWKVYNENNPLYLFIFAFF